VSSQNARIGYTCHHIIHTYWASHAQSAKKRAAEMGVELFLEPAITVAEQVAAIGDFIAQEVAAVIIGPVNGTDPALASAAEEVLAAGIPVISTSTMIEGVQVTCATGTDNLKGGESAAAYLAKRLDGRGKIALVDAPYPMPRVEGFRKTLEGHPGCSIAFSAPGTWTRESGARIMREALAAHSDIAAVYAANDLMALGALDAITEAGRGDILIVGFDGYPQVLAAISKGVMTATIDQRPFTVGGLSVEVAVKILRGESVPPVSLIDPVLVTADNVAEAALLPLEMLPALLVDLVESYDERQRAQEENLRLQREIIEAQRGTILELSTPIIPVWERVIVMPLIGGIDTKRARDMTRRLLAGIQEHRAQVVIVDITGVPVVDTGVAVHLNKTVQAARLKGARTIICGISDAVAETITDLGIDWSGIETAPNLQIALVGVLETLGMGST
jgi:ribose transport system substrate-binding protein